ncbi:hypothetical protein P8452_71308 [Trifolium repens]|nr:hypothetical protein P8452_71308 [Trifolium repens]
MNRPYQYSEVPPATAPSFGDDVQHDRNLNLTSVNKKSYIDNHVLKQDSFHWVERKEESNRKSGYPINYHPDHEIASMAALFQGRAMQLIARVSAALLYWPLIQLAGATTDDIVLGVAVGSKGRGNLPGSRPGAIFRELLDDTDSRVAYYSSAFLLKRMMTEKPEKYQNMLQNLVVKAKQKFV